MGLIADIARSYVAPRAVLRARIAGGDEVQAIGTVMLGCGLLFVSQWPIHARAAYLQPDIPLGARITGAAVALLMLMPLLMYGLAAVSHLVARLFGGQGRYFGARMALFWAVVAAGPLWLLNGLVAGFAGQGGGQFLVALLAVLAFMYVWLAGLAEAEGFGAQAARKVGE